jgi:hypothetical protein
MADPDYSHWLTKAQAADAIGVTTKTVEALAKASQVQQARWQPGGRGQTVRVYHPDDVARLAQERRQEPLPAFLVPSTAGPSNGNGSHTHLEQKKFQPGVPSGEDILRLVFAMAQRALTVEGEKKGEKDQKAEKWFLTLADASATSGLSERCLRRMIAKGTLDAEREPRSQWTADDRGWRIRRKDLEAL